MCMLYHNKKDIGSLVNIECMGRVTVIVLCICIRFSFDSAEIYHLSCTCANIGPAFGYYVNPRKTWLVTKDNLMHLAAEVFGDSCVNVTTDDRPVHGSLIGKLEYNH